MSRIGDDIECGTVMDLDGEAIIVICNLVPDLWWCALVADGRVRYVPGPRAWPLLDSPGPSKEE